MTSNRLEPCIKLPLEDGILEDIVEKAKDWALMHGEKTYLYLHSYSVIVIGLLFVGNHLPVFWIIIQMTYLTSRVEPFLRIVGGELYLGSSYGFRSPFPPPQYPPLIIG
jgi:hypothetical protein